MTEANEGARIRELSRLMALTASADVGARGEIAGELTRNLDLDVSSSPETLWHALWLAAGYHRQHRHYSEEEAVLERLTNVSDELGEPVLSARAYAALAQCEHMLGDYGRAVTVAQHACDLARELAAGHPELVAALTTLVAAETEAGRRLPDAITHAGQLLDVAGRAPALLRVRAQRTVAIVHARAGAYDKAVTVIEAAMSGIDSHDDPVLWLQVRLAAVSFYLQLEPPRLDLADELLGAAMPLLRHVGSPRHAQEALLLEARLAVARGDYPLAQDAVSTLDEEEPFLNNRDLHWLDMVRGELMIAENRRSRTS